MNYQKLSNDQNNFNADVEDLKIGGLKSSSRKLKVMCGILFLLAYGFLVFTLFLVALRLNLLKKLEDQCIIFFFIHLIKSDFI